MDRPSLFDENFTASRFRDEATASVNAAAKELATKCSEELTSVGGHAVRVPLYEPTLPAVKKYIAFLAAQDVQRELQQRGFYAFIVHGNGSLVHNAKGECYKHVAHYLVATAFGSAEYNEFVEQFKNIDTRS